MILEILDTIDYLTVAAFLFLNLVFWKKKINSCLIQGLMGVLLGIVLPIWSQVREIARYNEMHGKAVDSYELLYTFSIFLLYWVLMAVQLVLIRLKSNSNQARSD